MHLMAVPIRLSRARNIIVAKILPSTTIPLSFKQVKNYVTIEKRGSFIYMKSLKLFLSFGRVRFILVRDCTFENLDTKLYSVITVQLVMSHSCDLS